MGHDSQFEKHWGREHGIADVGEEDRQRKALPNSPSDTDRSPASSFTWIGHLDLQSKVGEKRNTALPSPAEGAWRPHIAR
jgi:hypothetical protein